MPLLKQPVLKPSQQFLKVDSILRPEPRAAAKRQHKVIAVMPAYNAEMTLAATLADVPPGSLDEVILVDDGSKYPSRFYSVI